MAEAEALDRWTRIEPGDIVLWRESDGSLLRWCASYDGWLRRGALVGPSLDEATLGLTTAAFVKISDPPGTGQMSSPSDDVGNRFEQLSTVWATHA